MGALHKLNTWVQSHTYFAALGACHKLVEHMGAVAMVKTDLRSESVVILYLRIYAYMVRNVVCTDSIDM